MLKSKFIALAAGAALLTGAATAQAADTWKVDPAHAFVYYKVSHFGWSNNMGRFNKISGSIVFDGKDVTTSKVMLEIEAASIDSAHEARDKHLKSPDFFNVKEFPTIKFVSTKVEKTGDRTGKITGNLTMHGQTHEVTLDVTWNRMSPHFRQKDRIHTGFSAVAKVSRLKWGIGKKFPPQAIGDEITLFIEIEAIKQ